MLPFTSIVYRLGPILNRPRVFGGVDVFTKSIVKVAPKVIKEITTALLAANIQVSMDGRALDNVFCERLWCSVKYENIYLNQYGTVPQLYTGLTAYFDFYNHERRHQSLNYRTPAEEHFVL